MRRITVRLPKELVFFADEHAKSLNITRSQVIAMALSALEKDVQLSAEGYRFYAQEASAFAEAMGAAASEVWTDYG